MSAEGSEFRMTVKIDLSCGSKVDGDIVHDGFRAYLEEQLLNFTVDVDNDDYDEDDEDSEETLEVTVTVDTIREIDVEEL